MDFLEFWEGLCLGVRNSQLGFEGDHVLVLELESVLTLDN